ncbi:uncharacterized protein LOC121558087, partial [Coregonus clupeaformis]|uniref:uncharacterized protein LOC121558087 n=1 Tax=Coregonus clupeaformis TaxID=59861 RepID=UPI001E1C9360
DLYHKVGGEVLLKPDKSTVPGSIISILWKHGKNKVAEWEQDFGGLEIYAAFKGRTALNQATGELRISGLTKTDSGMYSVEFNDKQLDKTYKLSVIKEVPKPTITSSCNTNKTSCTLTCEGDTTDAEPVTYSWKVGEGEWKVIDKRLVVSKSDTGNSNSGSKYFCKMKNSAGEGEVSEPVGQVFGPEPSEESVAGGVAGVVVVILVLVAIIIVWLVWKKKNGYPEYTWIDFLTKFCGGVFGDAVNKQNYIAPDTVYHTVGDDQVANRGVSGVLSGVAMDTVYGTVGEKTPRDYSMNQNDNNQPTNTANPSDGNNQTTGSDIVQPEQEVTVPLTDINITGKEDADNAGKGQENGGSDIVQPEQGVKVPQTAIPKTGEDDVDKAGKGQEKGADEPSGSNSPKDESKPEEHTIDEYKDSKESSVSGWWWSSWW